MAGAREKKSPRAWLLAYSGIAACCLAGASPVCAQNAKAGSSPAQPAPAPAEPSEVSRAWQNLTLQDLNFLAKTIPARYIYAFYPDPKSWNAQFQRSLDQARGEAALVHDFGSYRAVLQHFISTLDDAHASLYFRVLAKPYAWPGFTVRYVGGRYLVAHSEAPGIAEGAPVTACDGLSADQWMDNLAPYLGGPPGLETTRAKIAGDLLLDYHNPLYKLPQTCSVGGHDVTLNWIPFDWTEFNALQSPRSSASVETVVDKTESVSDFGTNGAWVRIGTMIPETQKQAAEFTRLIDQAPALRDKDFIVIDVRGNAGGIYNWFMAFLRALYGPDYADYYARARLEIGATNLAMPEPGEANPGLPGSYSQVKMPTDPPMEVDTGKPKVTDLPGGYQLVSTPPPIDFIRFPRKAPPSLVHGRVLLLTDYGCGSACISFVDEMRRFPGVMQIGAETHIDRRSGGWPRAYPLPSGNGVLRVGRMVREGRKRGENEAWKPAYRFPGDIADTPAVKEWILNDILKQKP